MPGFSSNPLRQNSLRWVLILPFALQTTLIASLIGYLTFRNGQKSVEDLAQQLETEVSKRVEQSLDQHLSLPQQINQMNADLIETGLLDLEEPEQAGKFFWDQAQLFEDAGYVGYARPTGEEAGAGRWVEGQDVVIFEGFGDREDHTYATDDQGNRGEIVETLDYNPLVGHWYIDAIKAEGAIWADISVTPGFEAYISATAAKPVYDQEGELLAVLLVDYLLGDINKFLAEIEVSPSGQVFIMQRDGFLVGNSSDDASYVVEGEDARQIPAWASSNSTIQLTAEQLQQRYPDFALIKQVERLKFDVDNETYFVQVTPWQDEYGLDWLVVTTVPQSDFTAQLQRNARNTILLSLAGLLMAIAIGSVTSRWITRPIKQLMAASQALAAGKLDEPVEVRGIEEIETLGAAFNQMAQQLKQTFEALKQSNQDLEAANDDLERRVEARTADLQQTLAELKQTQARLFQQEKMSSLGQLVAGVAHEVNNPVNFIYGNIAPACSYAEDLIELVRLYQVAYPDPSDEVYDHIEDIDLSFIEQDLPKLLQSMKSGAERIREIVKSLRNFSRLDESDLKQADLHEGLESTLMILQTHIKGKADQVSIDIVKDYGNLPKIHCYPGQLNQVFMNLLTNAIDALSPYRTEDADRQPTIRLKTQVMEGNQVAVYISDNGSGIPSDIQAKIFDPFFTTKPVGQGTGLGLSISYQIVFEKHDGALTCESIEGQGTQFKLLLPIELVTAAVQQSIDDEEPEHRPLALV